MKRSVLTLLVLLSTPLLSFGQSVWQGSCAVGTLGSLPSTGLYGASNSFAQNTLVTVENLDTNKTATVLIIDRLKQSGLFLLLSKDAGTAIGLSSGQVAQVRVTLAKQKLSAFRGPGDLPYNPDSDVFPAAGVGNPQSLAFLDQYLKGAQAGQPKAAPQKASPGAASPQPATAQPSAGPQAGTTPKVAGVEEPAVPGPQPSGKTGPPPSPQVAPVVREGPFTSGLETAQAPAAATSPLAATVAPAVPAEAGGVPVVSELQSMATPASAPQIALAQAPAVPEVRSLRPSSSALAAANPPSTEALPTLVAQVPQVPPTSAGEPQVSELAMASPQVARLPASVSALPVLPSEATAKGAGPVVSALAAAAPAIAGQQLALAGMPIPELTGLTPEISALVSGLPPAGAAGSVEGAAVPAPQIAAAPAGGRPAQPSKVAKAKPAAGAAAIATEAQQAQVAPTGAHRTPVRPSSAMTAGSYYVQLGAYFESSAALSLADNLSPDYPVSVYTFEQGKKSMYKVMIGPLNSAESGTLLYQFIAQGYTGAFVRKGD